MFSGQLTLHQPNMNFDRCRYMYVRYDVFVSIRCDPWFISTITWQIDTKSPYIILISFQQSVVSSSLGNFQTTWIPSCRDIVLGKWRHFESATPGTHRIVGQSYIDEYQILSQYMFFTLHFVLIALEKHLTRQKASVTAKSMLHLQYFGILLTVRNNSCW